MRPAILFLLLTLLSCQRDTPPSEPTDSAESNPQPTHQAEAAAPTSTADAESGETVQKPLDLSLPQDMTPASVNLDEPGREAMLPNFFAEESEDKKTSISGKVFLNEESNLEASAVQGAQITIETPID